MRVLSRYIISTLIIAAIATLLPQTPALASPAEQVSDSRIVRLETSRSTYLPSSQRAQIELEIENNGGFSREYQAIIKVLDPSGRVVFNSIDAADELQPVQVPAGESETVIVIWNGIEPKIQAGIYTLVATVRDWNDYNTMYDQWTAEDGATFEIRSQPVISVSQQTLDFGNFTPGQTPQVTFIVSNAGNGTLEWEIAQVPDWWVEVVRPTSRVTGTQTVVLQVREDAKISRFMRGEVFIESNVGVMEIPVSGTLIGDIDGRLVSVNPTRLTYRQGDSIDLQFELENQGTVALDYLLGVDIQGPDGTIVHDGIAEGRGMRVSLGPDTSKIVTYRWDIPLLAEVGTYRASASLVYFHDHELMFHDYFNQEFIPTRNRPLVYTDFEVQEGPRPFCVAQEPGPGYAEVRRRRGHAL